MQPPDPFTMQAVPMDHPAARRGLWLYLAKLVHLGHLQSPLGVSRMAALGGFPLTSRSATPQQCREEPSKCKTLLELQESPGELTLGKGPCVPPSCRSQGFMQLSQAWHRGPTALSQRFPLQQPRFGSHAEGEGLRQLCGLQFSSSQAPDLRREAGEAGITAGWSCSTSRGNSNKTKWITSL